jgi:hypothetical protein
MKQHACMRGPAQVYGASLRDAGSACLVMELVPGGNLHQRIYDRARPRMTHLGILQARAPTLCACMRSLSVGEYVSE